MTRARRVTRDSAGSPSTRCRTDEHGCASAQSLAITRPWAELPGARPTACALQPHPRDHERTPAMYTMFDPFPALAPLASERPTLPALARVPAQGLELVGESPRMRELLDALAVAARAPVPVLVTGAAGTGKTAVATALHDASPRRDVPLVTVNCAAVPAERIEAELFGRGRTRGLLASAANGTLLLEEVGRLPLAAQARLVEVLERGTFERTAGDVVAMRCDVRIVATSSEDLDAALDAGTLREDLHRYLAAVELQLPDLRERGDDVRLLARHFFGLAVERTGRDDLYGFASAALDAVAARTWPDNVRGLADAIERGTLLAAGPWLEADDVVRPHIPCRRTPAREEVLWLDDPRREAEEPCVDDEPRSSPSGLRRRV